MKIGGAQDLANVSKRSRSRRRSPWPHTTCRREIARRVLATIYNWLSDRDILIVKADRQEPLDLAASIPRRVRKQSVVPRQAIMLAVFRVVPKINIKFLSEFWVQTAEILGISGCRPCDHILIIT